MAHELFLNNFQASFVSQYVLLTLRVNDGDGQQDLTFIGRKLSKEDDSGR